MMPAMTWGGASTSFEQQRPRLRAIAYRMLGSDTEAEDIVQEAWLRFSAQGQAPESPRAFLTTVVTRLCLDQLKSARAQRETYVGPWLPEPIAESDDFDAESLTLAFLVLLESLSPVERAVFLLHQVFDYTHGEIADMLERDQASVRQLFHRAKEYVAARRPRFTPTRQDHERLLMHFLAACGRGDLDGLKALLAEDAISWSDGGGRAKSALKPVQGADNVARLVLGLAKKQAPGSTLICSIINGQPGLLVKRDGHTTFVMTIESDGNKIFALHGINNPDKLQHV